MVWYTSLYGKKTWINKFFDLTKIDEMCFETTSENTGLINGLFVVFEHIRQKINEYVCQTLQEACIIKYVDYISMIIYTRIMSIYQRNWKNSSCNTLYMIDTESIVFSILESLGNFFMVFEVLKNQNTGSKLSGIFWRIN